jgi:tripartite-type tricarboxylate transporter receptor subunit TctC
MAGRIHYQFDNTLWSMPLIKEGKLKGLALTTLKRSALAPDMPTIAESGIAGFEGISWIALVVPVKTPEDVVARLNRELNTILSDPKFIELVAATGAEAAAASGQKGFRELLEADIARWEAIFRSGRIKLK